MCEFISCCLVGDEVFAEPALRSHSGAEKYHKLSPGSYREVEWTSNHERDLRVRVDPNGEHDENWYRAIVLAQWPTRAKLLEHLCQQVGTVATLKDGAIEIHSANAKTVYARGCTGLTKLDAPNAEYVYARGCTGLTKLDAPNAEYVYASGCTGLTKLDAPNAKTVYARGCTGLTKSGVMVK